MAIILKSEKGLPLSHAEMDGNFIDIDSRLVDLETTTPASYQSLTLNGSALSISGGNTVNLPPSVTTQISVSQNTASGNGSLTYDNATGVFTYTPPDIGSGGSSFDQDLNTTDGVTFQTLGVTGNTILTSDLTVGGNVFHAGDANVTGNLAVLGNSNISGNETISGDLNVLGNASVIGTVTLTSGAEIGNDLTVTDKTINTPDTSTGGANSGTATALDVTKTLQVLNSADGDDDWWSLADGTEGQIMHFVPGTGAGTNQHKVTIQNWRRWDSGAGVAGEWVVETNLDWLPFKLDFDGTSWTGVATAIFTDGAWQTNNPWID